jgi:hypothetical protein
VDAEVRHGSRVSAIRLAFKAALRRAADATASAREVSRTARHRTDGRPALSQSPEPHRAGATGGGIEFTHAGESSREEQLWRPVGVSKVERAKVG